MPNTSWTDRIACLVIVTVPLLILWRVGDPIVRLIGRFVLAWSGVR